MNVFINRVRDAFAIYALTQDTQVRTEPAPCDFVSERL